MGYILLNEVRLEFINFLRNSDVFTNSERNVTTATESFTASGGAEIFTVSNANCKNIRSVKQNGTALTYYTDYTIDLDNAQVSVSKSLTASDDIDIEYDYGTDAIFPDFPRPDISLSSFPRMAFMIYNYLSEIAGAGNVLNTSFTIQINIYDKSSEALDDKIDSLRQSVISAQTSLKTVAYMYPTNVMDLGVFKADTSGKKKILARGLELEFKNNFEIN